MYHYIIYGTHLVTDREFVQLVTADSTMAHSQDQITITQGMIPDSIRFDKTCYSKIHRDISYLSNSTCYLYIEQGTRITYELKDGASPELLNTYLLGWGMSILFYQRDCIAIHCSCVANSRGAVLISGASGSGKSTVTSYLLEHNYRLLADDMSIIKFSKEGTALAAPAFPYQKLCRNVVTDLNIPQDDLIYIDEDKDKFLVTYTGEFNVEAAPIRALILLSRNSSLSEVICHEIKGVDKMHACISTLFLKPLLGSELYAPEIGSLCLKLASMIPIYEIIRPTDKNTQEKICDTIEKLLL